MTRIFIAGYGGFIGSHLAEHIAETTDWEICNTKPNYIRNPDYIVHLSGCSNIDKSIASPVDTVRFDIEKTLELLQFARSCGHLKKFLYFSSDEVFGPKEDIEDFKPWDRYNSHSPYAAGKAACEELCLAWASTYGVPTVITHCQNLIGERQPANKFLPTVVRCALQGESVPIYGDGFKWAKRNYLHVRDACAAIVLLLQRGTVRGKYNIATHDEIDNRDLIWTVGAILGKEIKFKPVSLTALRPGFFVQHGLNGNKLKELGWKRQPLLESLTKTVLWMAAPENRHWLGL